MASVPKAIECDMKPELRPLIKSLKKNGVKIGRLALKKLVTTMLSRLAVLNPLARSIILLL